MFVPVLVFSHIDITHGGLLLLINAWPQLGLFLDSLNYPIYLLPLDFFLFLLLCILLSLFLYCWIAGPQYPPFLRLLLNFPFSHIYSPCLSAPPILSWPAIGRSALYQINQVFQTGKVTQLYRVKQMQHKRMKYTFASLNKNPMA